MTDVMILQVWYGRICIPLAETVARLRACSRYWFTSPVTLS